MQYLTIFKVNYSILFHFIPFSSHFSLLTSHEFRVTIFSLFQFTSHSQTHGKLTRNSRQLPVILFIGQKLKHKIGNISPRYLLG